MDNNVGNMYYYVILFNRVYFKMKEIGERMKEFDNIETSKLHILLNENTILKRFYPLIPICDSLSNELIKLKITDKYMFFKYIDAEKVDLASKLGIDMETLKLLESLFHLYDFKNRKLKEVECVNPMLVKELISDNIKTSKDYLLLCISENIETISKRYKVNLADVIHLFDICDLMRLPGVKDIRASLYYDCGYKRLQDFATEKPDDMRKNIELFIIKTKSDKSVPLRKELSTQIAVAKVLPYILPCMGECV